MMLIPNVLSLIIKVQKEQPDIDFIFCDYTNPLYSEKLVELLNHYMADPMGGCSPLSNEKAGQLVNGLAAHPSSFVLFVSYNKAIAGLATCFINFSTFKVSPYINVHDIVIQDKYRGKGLGKALLQNIIAIAAERDYCKVTLEVRDDNIIAKALYKELGFADTEPVMHFWTKSLH